MRLICMLLLVPLLAFAGCSSGSGTPIDAALQEVADCTGLGLEDVAGLTEGFFDLLEAIDSGTTPAGITYDLTAKTFSFPADLNDDGIADGTVSGTFDTQDDLTDGIDVNENLTTAWNLVAGQVSGTGNFGFERTAANVFGLTGNGVVNGGPDCSFAVTAADLTFDIGAVATAVSGSLDFSTNTLGSELTGSITFNPASDLADVVATFLGATVRFDIDLDTFAVIF